MFGSHYQGPQPVGCGSEGLGAHQLRLIGVGVELHLAQQEAAPEETAQQEEPEQAEINTKKAVCGFLMVMI